MLTWCLWGEGVTGGAVEEMMIRMEGEMMTETEEEVAKTETDEQREIEKEEKIMTEREGGMMRTEREEGMVKTGKGEGMKTGEGRMKRTEGGLGGTGSEMTKTEGRTNMMGGGETMRGKNGGGRKTGVMAMAREDGKTMNMGSGVVVIIEIETEKEEDDRTGTEMAEAQVADMIEMGGKERKGMIVMIETGRETTRGKGPVRTITVAGREKDQLSEAWIG